MCFVARIQPSSFPTCDSSEAIILRISRVALAFGLISAAPSSALAQAWIGEQNDLSLSLTSQLTLLDNLAIFDGSAIQDLFSATALDFELGVEYVPIDSFAVRLRVPFKAITYTGEQTAPPGTNLGGLDFAHGAYDDGSMHFTTTDLSLELAYMFFGDTFALTPFVRGSLPTGYEWKGYAAAGLGLKQLALGLSLGLSGSLLTPDLYALFLNMSYSYSFVERLDENTMTSEVNVNRSDANAQLGYFILDPLAIFVSFDLLLTHDGIELDGNYRNLPPDLKANHDPLLRQQAIFFGGGLFYQITDTFGANVNARFMLSAQNVMKATIFQLGLTWAPDFF